MFFRNFFFDFTANAPCFSTDFVRVVLILGIMKWLLFIFSFLHVNEIIENREGSYDGPENSENWEDLRLWTKWKKFCEKYGERRSTIVTPGERASKVKRALLGGNFRRLISVPHHRHEFASLPWWGADDSQDVDRAESRAVKHVTSWYFV